MNVERYLRLIAGTFVLVSLLLGYLVSPYFFLFTGFVALNLIQSAFTDWCPMMSILQKLGVKNDGSGTVASHRA
ncbi:MAG TPA: DUF2892 domain-containing protein [Blastocatellia bacterium]|nr:DUF2892 domain-containing protein [Blastocatellia bacterium]